MGVNGFLGRIGRALARAREPGPPRLEVLWPYSPGAPARVGLVSGSFDPMTVAHAALAETLGRTSDLVVLLYSPATLPKEAAPGGEPGPALLPPGDRVASLLAYARHREGLGVGLCSHGLYADQAEAAHATFPQGDLVFGVGSDKVVQLMDAEWYRDREGRDAALERLFSLARVAYAVREAEEDRLDGALAEASRWRDRIEALDLPPELAGVSSRSVREELARGGDVGDLVPAEVLPFVARRSP
jgi:nicotinic acid mononucleotide adenylyltransferase